MNKNIDHAALTPLQEAYFVGQQRSVELNAKASYYIELSFDKLDVNRFASALKIVSTRHDIFGAWICDQGWIRFSEAIDPKTLLRRSFSDYTMNPDASGSSVRQSMLALVDADNDAQSAPFYISVSRNENSGYSIHILFYLIYFSGTGINNFLRELSFFYNSPEGVVDLPQQSYRAYLEERTSAKMSPMTTRSATYWEKRLNSIPSAPELPVYLDKVGIDRVSMKRLQAVLTKNQWEAFKDNATFYGSTPANALLTAYSHIVAFWSKSPRFVITVMVEGVGMSIEQMQTMIGNFASTLLVEIDYSVPTPFGQRSKELRKRMFMDLAHSQVCGTDVLRAKNKSEGSVTRAGSPVAFVATLEERIDPSTGNDLINFYGKNVTYSRMFTPQVWLDHQAAVDTQGQLLLNWDYVAEIFEKNTIDSMFSSYCELLTKLSRDRSFWESIVSISSLDETKRLPQVPDFSLLSSQDRLLNELFLDSVRAHSHYPAVIYGEQTITYGQLQQASDWITMRLLSQGTVACDVVAIYMNKGWEQIAAILAIHAAGAAYLPIDPALPTDRIDYILSECNVSVLLTQEHLSAQAGKAHAVGREIIPVGSDALSVNTSLKTQYTRNIKNLAYIIFTSGSTGTPKGVMLNHEGPVNTIQSINSRYNVKHTDRVFSVSSLSFDLSVYDVFGALAAGAAIVLPDADRPLDMKHWADIITRHNVTVWNSVPQLMQLFAEYVESRPVQVIESLRLVLLSGDWIPVTLPGKIHALFKPQHIVSLGGATEASIWSNYHDIIPGKQYTTSIPYGQALDNQEIYVLDIDLNPRPVDVPGSIYIAGTGLAMGYWKDVEKTSNSFITTPSGKKLYRTGDIGKYLSNGEIEFLGREDNQVKVNGFRVEIGEIQTALTSIAFVNKCVVTIVGQGNSGDRLVAFVVAEKSKFPGANWVKEELALKLPHYMIPSVISLVTDLPLTSNGKIERNALLGLLGSEASEEQRSRPVATKTEQLVADIWSDLFSTKEDDVLRQFFDIGGTSFLAVQMIQSVNDRFNSRVSIPDFLANPTISHIASLIENQSSENGLNTDSNIVQLSVAQHAKNIFFIHPSGGDVLCYTDLAKSLEHQFNIYALRMELSQELSQQRHLEAVAAIYHREIVRIQPTGPYVIGGWSFGGVVAYEIFKHIKDNFADEDLLLLIDSPSPFYNSTSSDEDLLLWFFQDLAQLSDAELEPLVAEHLTTDITHDHFVKLVAALQERELLSVAIDAEYAYRYFCSFRSNIEILHKYQATRHAVPNTLLFKSKLIKLPELSSHPYSASPDWGWGALIGSNLEVMPLEGDHYDVFETSNVEDTCHAIVSRLSHSGT